MQNDALNEAFYINFRNFSGERREWKKSWASRRDGRLIVVAEHGCTCKEIDWIFTQELIFYNRTGVTARLESYDGDELKALWTIEPEQLTMKQTWNWR